MKNYIITFLALIAMLTSSCVTQGGMSKDTYLEVTAQEAFTTDTEIEITATVTPFEETPDWLDAYLHKKIKGEIVIYELFEGETNTSVIQGEFQNHSFKVLLMNLKSQTDYEFFARVQYNSKEYLSETRSFTTGKAVRKTSLEYVDLGLSVDWATCNLGADVTEKTGNYYAWAETTIKDSYTWDNYLFGNGSLNQLSKYNSSADKGTVDNLVLMSESVEGDDPATKTLGTQWKTPTKQEWEELMSCSWARVIQNGILGYKITNNGKSIFLPAGGFRSANLFYEMGEFAYYWTNGIDNTNPLNAYCLKFASRDALDDNNTTKAIVQKERYVGLPIRPVRTK